LPQQAVCGQHFDELGRRLVIVWISGKEPRHRVLRILDARAIGQLAVEVAGQHAGRLGDRGDAGRHNGQILGEIVAASI
jgi:hypothetical protein